MAKYILYGLLVLFLFLFFLYIFLSLSFSFSSSYLRTRQKKTLSAFYGRASKYSSTIYYETDNV
nr:MAG TPA: chitin synthase regulator [Caudoviricetes sp.]